MRILFDGYWWHDGPLANRSVQRDLINTWCELFGDDEVIVATRAKHSRESGDDLPPAPTVPVRLWPQAVSNLVELPLIARRLRADVTLVHNYTPLAGRSATFIHDVMFAEHPEWFSGVENLYFSRMLPWAQRAAAVFTSSEVEAARIRRHARGNLPVTAIGLAIPQSLATVQPRRPAAVPEPGGYGLCVGRLNIRKNLAAVLRGSAASGAITPETPMLVVGSAEHSGRDAQLPEEFRGLVAAGSVRFLGRISEAELAWLYRHAALVVYLSLDEGFGLPPVEAARFGAPLLVSDIPVLRETVGGYAEFVDPLGPAEVIAAGIDRSWGRPGDAKARTDALGRYEWRKVVTRLRDSLLATMG